MGEKRTINRTEAYKLSKDMKSQERKYKEAKKLAKKKRERKEQD